MEILFEIFGWIGSFLIVLAYFCVSTKRWDSINPTFQWVNLLGALCLGVNVFYKKSWPAVSLEIIWAAIAVYALMKSKESAK